MATFPSFPLKYELTISSLNSLSCSLCFTSLMWETHYICVTFYDVHITHIMGNSVLCRTLKASALRNEPERSADGHNKHSKWASNIIHSSVWMCLIRAVNVHTSCLASRVTRGLNPGNINKLFVFISYCLEVDENQTWWCEYAGHLTVWITLNQSKCQRFCVL